MNTPPPEAQPGVADALVRLVAERDALRDAVRIYFLALEQPMRHRLEAVEGAHTAMRNALALGAGS